MTHRNLSQSGTAEKRSKSFPRGTARGLFQSICTKLRVFGEVTQSLQQGQISMKQVNQRLFTSAALEQISVSLRSRGLNIFFSVMM